MDPPDYTATRGGLWLRQQSASTGVVVDESDPKRSALLAQRFFGRGLEWFRLQLSVLLEQNLHFAFRVLELLPAGCGELHAFFEQRQRLLQRNLPFFQFLNDLLETLKAIFKLHQSNYSCIYCNAVSAPECPAKSSNSVQTFGRGCQN